MIQNRNFVTYLLLSFVTCGIYSIYFMYKLVQDTNTMCDQDEPLPNYFVVLLLTIVTCGIYNYFFLYKFSEKIYNNGNNKYQAAINENGMTMLLWFIIGSFVLGIGYFIGMYLAINNFNKIADKYNGTQA